MNALCSLRASPYQNGRNDALHLQTAKRAEATLLVYHNPTLSNLIWALRYRATVPFSVKLSSCTPHVRSRLMFICLFTLYSLRLATRRFALVLNVDFSTEKHLALIRQRHQPFQLRHGVACRGCSCVVLRASSFLDDDGSELTCTVSFAGSNIRTAPLPVASVTSPSQEERHPDEAAAVSLR